MKKKRLQLALALLFISLALFFLAGIIIIGIQKPQQFCAKVILIPFSLLMMLIPLMIFVNGSYLRPGLGEIDRVNHKTTFYTALAVPALAGLSLFVFSISCSEGEDSSAAKKPLLENPDSIKQSPGSLSSSYAECSEHISMIREYTPCFSGPESKTYEAYKDRMDQWFKGLLMVRAKLNSFLPNGEMLQDLDADTSNALKEHLNLLEKCHDSAYLSIFRESIRDYGFRRFLR